VAAWHNQSRALHLLGRLDEAYQAAEHARALAEQEGDVHRIAAVESHLADLLHAQGRSEEARCPADPLGPGVGWGRPASVSGPRCGWSSDW
jgi:heme oxygenase